jgi:GNAT superfamily N-acetyltransferase
MAADRTEREWASRMARSMQASWRAVAAGSPGARVLEPEGVLAIVLPAVPERSIFNAVLYDDAEGLAAALGELGEAYDEAGVEAWTVWSPADDEASAGRLASAGHVLDSSPRAMALELDRFQQPDPGDLEWTGDGSIDAVKLVNDVAYGFEAGTFERGLGAPPPGTWRIYEAREGGEPVSVLMTTDVEGDCGVWWVGTVPQSQGRGLAGLLLGVALAEARQRGMETSTLQASARGAPVYTRLGYEDVGELRMWERRRR